MKSGLYGLRKGHKNRNFILLFNSLLPTTGNASIRLLKSRTKIRFLCLFLRPYKPNFISKNLRKFESVNHIYSQNCSTKCFFFRYHTNLYGIRPWRPSRLASRTTVGSILTWAPCSPTVIIPNSAPKRTS